MNINEQMDELGQIGNAGYTPTADVVDQLASRTRRSRAFRHGTASLVGSIGAIGLGLLGAQVVVSLTHDDNDAAAIADRNFNIDSMNWEDKYGSGYTGLGKTQDELAQAWADLQAAAAAKAKQPAPAKTTAPATTKPAAPTCEYQEKTQDGWIYYKSTATGCGWVKKEKVEEPEIPDGYFLFGNGEVYKCEQWTDTATGEPFWGAWSGTGDWGYKMIQCEPGDKYWYEYKYMGSSATINGHTCTGSQVSYLGAPHRISCRTNDALWGMYPEWNSATGSPRWSLNNDDGKILISPATYKWFRSGVCESTLYSNSLPFFRLPACHQAACDGWYYTTSQHPTKNGDRYSWNGSTWVVDNPTPTPTPTPPEE